MSQIRLVLEFFHPWINHIGFYHARERGYYRDYGIDLDIVASDPYRGDSLTQLERYEADFRINYPSRLLALRENGAKLKSVAAINQRSLIGLITLPDQGINRPRDLEDKRVGIPKSSRITAILRSLIQTDGGNPENVTIVPYVPSEPLATDIADGKINATLGSLWNWEGLVVKQHGLAPIIFKIDEIGIPQYPEQLVITREDLIARNPVLIRNFIAATARGYAEAVATPQQAVDAFHPVISYFPRWLLDDSQRVTAPTWEIGEGWGQHRADPFDQYAQWLQQSRLLSGSAPIHHAYTNEFLP